MGISTTVAVAYQNKALKKLNDRIVIPMPFSAMSLLS